MVGTILSAVTEGTKIVSQITGALGLTPEQKTQVDVALADIAAKVEVAEIEKDKQLTNAKRDIIVAEAKSGNWYVSGWRPTLMYLIMFLIICDTFGWTEYRLDEQAWLLIQIGMGGYVGGRSVEKIVPTIMGAIKEKKQNG